METWDGRLVHSDNLDPWYSWCDWDPCNHRGPGTLCTGVYWILESLIQDNYTLCFTGTLESVELLEPEAPWIPGLAVFPEVPGIPGVLYE